MKYHLGTEGVFTSDSGSWAQVYVLTPRTLGLQTPCSRVSSALKQDVCNRR